jgi:hypothetical protein
MQLVDASHQLEIGIRDPDRPVVQRGPRQVQQLRLSRQAQLVLGVDRRFALDPGIRPSAPDKKSISCACWPIFAWSSYSGTGSAS